MNMKLKQVVMILFTSVTLLSSAPSFTDPGLMCKMAEKAVSVVSHETLQNAFKDGWKEGVTFVALQKNKGIKGFFRRHWKICSVFSALSTIAGAVAYCIKNHPTVINAIVDKCMLAYTALTSRRTQQQVNELRQQVEGLDQQVRQQVDSLRGQLTGLDQRAGQALERLDTFGERFQNSVELLAGYRESLDQYGQRLENVQQELQTHPERFRQVTQELATMRADMQRISNNMQSIQQQAQIFFNGAGRVLSQLLQRQSCYRARYPFRILRPKRARRSTTSSASVSSAPDAATDS